MPTVVMLAICAGMDWCVHSRTRTVVSYSISNVSDLNKHCFSNTCARFTVGCFVCESHDIEYLATNVRSGDPFTVQWDTLNSATLVRDIHVGWGRDRTRDDHITAWFINIDPHQFLQ